MKNVVITIARHFGSGGKTVGKMLSEDLGIGFYEHEIIEMASEDSGIAEELFNQADEKLKRTPLFFGKAHGEYKGKLIAPGSDEFVSDHNLFNYQAKIISVFVHASRKYCVEQAVERRAYVGKDVEKFVERTDKYRSDFYRYYTGQEWTDARNYDLCLNSERLGFEGTMEAIEEYIKVRFGGLPGTKK